GSTTSVAVLYSHHPDIVIWCTAANQAWKATELETWTALPPRLRKHGLLVATHTDLLPSAAARATVRERLQHDAGPYFSGIVMIGKPRRTSLVSASTASDEWQSDAKAELFKTLAAHLSGIAEFRLARARRMVARLTSRALDQL
ncbi:MAG: hypothetical protein KDJ36_03035, partial [Hyphomicrobiaceae bacterium]|nr:hypothetical protein [Hyphomicrobiaceae bacterium]